MIHEIKTGKFAGITYGQDITDTIYPALEITEKHKTGRSIDMKCENIFCVLNKFSDGSCMPDTEDSLIKKCITRLKFQAFEEKIKAEIDESEKEIESYHGFTSAAYYIELKKLSTLNWVLKQLEGV